MEAFYEPVSEHQFSTITNAIRVTPRQKSSKSFRHILDTPPPSKWNEQIEREEHRNEVTDDKVDKVGLAVDQRDRAYNRERLVEQYQQHLKKTQQEFFRQNSKSSKPGT